jgi:hypothetical protein
MSDSAYIDPRTEEGEEIGVAMPGRASSKSAKTKGGATASQAETATSGGQGVAMPGRASSKSAKIKGGATASQAETATSGGQGVAMPGRASSEKAKTKGVAMPGATSE